MKLKSLSSKLKRDSDFWRRIFSSYPDYLFILDRHFKILEANKACERIFGMSRQQLKQKHCFEVSHRRKSPLANCPCVRTLKTKKAAAEYVDILGRKVLVLTFPLLDKKGKIEAIVHIAKDISDIMSLEKELSERERFFRLLFEELREAVLVLDHRRKIIDANRAASVLLGYSRQEFQKRRLRDIIAAQDLAQIEVAINEELVKINGWLTYIEARVISKLGEKIQAELNITTLREKDEQVFVIIMRDITYRKKREKALLESERKFRAIVENTIDVVVVLQGGKIVFANSQFEKVFGIKLSSLEKNKIKLQNLVEREQRACFLKNLRLLRRKSLTFSEWEIKFICRNRKKVPFHINVSAFSWQQKPALLCTARDLSRIKEAEADLRKREEQLRLILDNSADIIFTCRGGKVAYITPAVKRVLGYEIAEIVGKSCYRLVAPSSRKVWDKILNPRTYRASKTPVFTIEAVTKDKRKVFFELKPSLLRHNKHFEVQIVARDISERKRLEEVKEALLRLEEFISSVSFKFINAKWEDADTAINESLAELGSAIEADSIYISLLEDNKVRDAYIWVKGKKAKEFFSAAGEVEAEEMKWCFRQFRHNEPLVIENVDELPSAAFTLQRKLKAEKAASALVMPLMSRKETLGCIRVERKKLSQWQEEERLMFQTFVDVITGMLEKKIAEEALRKSEKRLRHIMDNTHDIIFNIDLEGNYTFLNKAAEEISGYSLSEVLKANIKDIVAPEHLEFLQELIRKRMREEELPQVYTFDIITKQGQRRTLEVSTDGIYDEKGKLVGIEGVARDITEKKKEEECRLKMSRLVQVQSEIAHLFIERKRFDKVLPQVLEKAGRALEVSRAYVLYYSSDYKFLNYLGEWHKEGIDFHMQTAKSLDASSFVNLQQTAARGEIVRVDDIELFDWPMKDFFSQQDVKALLLAPIFVNNKLYGIVGLSQAERRREWEDLEINFLQDLSFLLGTVIERENYSSELERIKAIISNLKIGIYRYTPGSQGRFIEINQAMLEMFEADSKEEFMKVKVAELYQNPAEEKVFSEKLMKNSFVAGEEVRLRTLKGKPIVCAVWGVRREDEMGNSYFDGAIVDVTEKKKTEKKLAIAYRKLAETENQLIQSEKMAILGTISSSIAHEIRNPLGVILNGSEYLESVLKNKDELVTMVINKIKAAALRANSIIVKLLEFSRASEMKPEKIKVSEMISESLVLLENRANLAGIEIEKNTEVDGIVFVDRIMMEQVLFNLYKNAFDAMLQGGKLKIITRRESNKIVIEVIDNGIGIPEENLKKIFDAFYTTKEKGKGTGMGLGLCLMIVERHKGELRVESKVGQGSKFSVILPLAE